MILINEDGVDREPTAQELAEFEQRQIAAAKALKDAAQQTAFAASGREKLKNLGLTDDEIQALLGVSRE